MLLSSCVSFSQVANPLVVLQPVNDQQLERCCGLLPPMFLFKDRNSGKLGATWIVQKLLNKDNLETPHEEI